MEYELLHASLALIKQKSTAKSTRQAVPHRPDHELKTRELARFICNLVGLVKSLTSQATFPSHFVNELAHGRLAS